MPLDQSKPKKILCDLQLLLQKPPTPEACVSAVACVNIMGTSLGLRGPDGSVRRAADGMHNQMLGWWNVEGCCFFCLWTYGWWWWWWCLITYIDMNNTWGPNCTGVGRAQIEKHWSEWFVAHLPLTVTFEKGMLPFWLEVIRIDHHHNLIQEKSIMDIK